jgi:hypothetical protein
MPGKQRQATTTQGPQQAAPTTGQAPTGAQDQLGNAALQSQLPGQTSLYGELRAKVGDKLAELITENLSEDDLLGHVTPLIEDLVARAQELSAGDAAAQGLSEEQLGAVFAELDGKLDEAAKQLLAQLDLDGKLSAIAKDHTELVALAAIAGVVAWALSNPDLPAFDTTKDLGGGHSLGASLDLGHLLELTIQHLEAAWTFDGESTDASLKVFGGENEGGWGGEGELKHTLGGGGVLGATGRYFGGDTGQEASGGLSFDGKRTDASLSGDWSRSDGLDEWGLATVLSHDGESTDLDLDAAFRRQNGQDTLGLGGKAVHEGTHSTTTLQGRYDRGPDSETGFLSGRHVRDKEGLRQEYGGRYNLDGSWTADAGLQRTDGDRRWALGAKGQGGADGGVLGELTGSHRDTHDGYDHALSGAYRTDGSWDARGSLTGQDQDNPWSLSAQAGRTSLDPELDWSITGKMARQLDDQGNTVVSGQQSLGRDSASSRLQLDQSLGGDHSLSAWVERQRTADGTLDALGGSLNTSVMGADAYAKGWAKSNNTWEASAGISKGTAKDDLSWFAEGYTGRDLMGQQDSGVRAGLSWRF